LKLTLNRFLTAIRVCYLRFYHKNSFLGKEIFFINRYFFYKPIRNCSRVRMPKILGIALFCNYFRIIRIQKHAAQDLFFQSVYTNYWRWLLCLWLRAADPLLYSV